MSIPLTCNTSARPSRRPRSGKNAPVVVLKVLAIAALYFVG
ncbi:hypothetical protein [Streptomyces violaceusniger]|nr:hypothetical protein [Streptomyces violaceusniger]